MPLTLTPPKTGRSPYYRVRGSHLGVRVDRTTKLIDKKKAQHFLRKWEEEIERGEFRTREDRTFASAALAYTRAGHETRFLSQITDYYGSAMALADIDQQSIDTCAAVLLPNATPATRNRQVYTPISAILKHAGVDAKLRRPKGSQGKSRTTWLWPEEAERLFMEAHKVHPRFGALLVVLCYTGLRLSEALRVKAGDVRLAESFLYAGVTKNGEPRAVHLPPQAVKAIASLEAKEGRIFRLTKSGFLYNAMKEATKAAGVAASFHTLRHTYGTWMSRYAGMDARQLVATGAWKDIKSAVRYSHTVVNEEARKADMLPGAKNG